MTVSIKCVRQVERTDMHGLGVRVAVMRGDEILLVQREDSEVWSLPGGEIDSGESPAQTAIREVYEETGLTVKLTRLVGLYTTPQWTAVNTSNVVFAAEIVAGYLRSDGSETLKVEFFPRGHLPDQLIAWVRSEVEDALAGIGGSIARTQDVSWPDGNPSRAELYARRDNPGLSRLDYFRQMFSMRSETIDVPGRVCGE